MIHSGLIDPGPQMHILGLGCDQSPSPANPGPFPWAQPLRGGVPLSSWALLVGSSAAVGRTHSWLCFWNSSRFLSFEQDAEMEPVPRVLHPWCHWYQESLLRSQVRRALVCFPCDAVVWSLLPRGSPTPLCPRPGWGRDGAGSA